METTMADPYKLPRDIIDRMVRTGLAEAWEHGFHAGREYQTELFQYQDFTNMADANATMPPPPTNPFGSIQ